VIVLTIKKIDKESSTKEKKNSSMDSNIQFSDDQDTEMLNSAYQSK
jgi:hypothetical protein